MAGFVLAGLLGRYDVWGFAALVGVTFLGVMLGGMSLAPLDSAVNSAAMGIFAIAEGASHSLVVKLWLASIVLLHLFASYSRSDASP